MQAQTGLVRWLAAVVLIIINIIVHCLIRFIHSGNLAALLSDATKFAWLLSKTSGLVANYEPHKAFQLYIYCDVSCLKPLYQHPMTFVICDIHIHNPHCACRSVMESTMCNRFENKAI